MKANKKAIELVNKHKKFQTYTVGFDVNTHSDFVLTERAIQSALITVSEIIKDRERLKDSLFHNPNYWDNVEKILKETNVSYFL